MRFQYTVKATITVTKWVELQTTLTKNILNEEENKSVLRFKNLGLRCRLQHSHPYLKASQTRIC